MALCHDLWTGKGHAGSHLEAKSIAKRLHKYFPPHVLFPDLPALLSLCPFCLKLDKPVQLRTVGMTL